MSEPEQKPDERRAGIHNSSIIDLVSCNKETKRGTLTMIEDRPWSDLDLNAWGREVMTKVNLYLSYSEERLFLDYPQLSRESPKILLTCLSHPPPEVIVKLKKLKLLLEQERIEFFAADVARRVKIEI